MSKSSWPVTKTRPVFTDPASRPPLISASGLLYKRLIILTQVTTSTIQSVSHNRQCKQICLHLLPLLLNPISPFTWWSIVFIQSHDGQHSLLGIDEIRPWPGYLIWYSLAHNSLFRSCIQFVELGGWKTDVWHRLSTDSHMAINSDLKHHRFDADMITDLWHSSFQRPTYPESYMSRNYIQQSKTSMQLRSDPIGPQVLLW